VKELSDKKVDLDGIGLLARENFCNSELNLIMIAKCVL